jgi:hypothetical protein
MGLGGGRGGALLIFLLLSCCAECVNVICGVSSRVEKAVGVSMDLENGSAPLLPNAEIQNSRASTLAFHCRSPSVHPVSNPNSAENSQSYPGDV